MTPTAVPTDSLPSRVQAAIAPKAPDPTPAPTLPAPDHPAILHAQKWLASQNDMELGTILIRDLLFPLGFYEDPEAVVGDRAEFGRRIKTKVMTDGNTRFNSRMLAYARWHLPRSRPCLDEPQLLAVVLCKVAGMEVIIDLAMRGVMKAGG